ncbi:Uma2 family endonuclease [Nonomuraea wenchangensis]
MRVPHTARDLFDALPSLPGFRAEVIEGKLIVSPMGTPEHLWIAADLHDALQPLRRERGWRGSPQGPSVCIEGSRDSLAPDYVLVPPRCARWGQEVLSSYVIMVAEVVSPSSVHIDREEKRHLYAVGRVPVYLLIDPVPETPTVTVHSDIADGAYRSIATVPMGKPLPLPAPVDFELDTSVFMM